MIPHHEKREEFNIYNMHPHFDEQFLKSANKPPVHKNIILMHYEDGTIRKFG